MTDKSTFKFWLLVLKSFANFFQTIHNLTRYSNCHTQKHYPITIQSLCVLDQINVLLSHFPSKLIVKIKKLGLSIKAKHLTFLCYLPTIFLSWWLWKYVKPKIAAVHSQVSHFQTKRELTEIPFTSLVFVNSQWNDFIQSIISGKIT